jgi:DNA replication and repair protein RecF
VRLTGVAVRDFRSWSTLDLPLQPGVTVFLGRNGLGKTNLVEAINTIATLGSHRVASNAPLIRIGADRAIVQVGVVNPAFGERVTKVELTLTPKGAPVAAVNGTKATRTRDILGLLRTVLFAPEDLDIVRRDPSERRKFIDELLVARHPRYAEVMSDYSRVLKQRSTLLRTASAAVRNSASSRDTLYATLDAWDTQSAVLGARLVAGRLNTLDMLRGPAIERLLWLTDGADTLSIDYDAYNSHMKSVITEGTNPGEELLTQALREDLRERREDEIRRGVVLVGPQRDDINLAIGGIPTKGHASHGQSWSVALALRLASFDVLREQSDSEPVLLLDDVFAELDTSRREKLADAIEGVEQVIITAAVEHDVPERLLTRCIPMERTAQGFENVSK